MKHIFPAETKLNRERREDLLGQKAKVIWFTGLSGSGKTTLAVHLEEALYQQQFKTYLLDGDNIRAGINKNLGFSEEDRKENIRRIGEIARLFQDAGIVVIASFISPFRADREWVRDLVGQENFIEVFVDCPLEVCEARDVKGLYRKARTGEVKNFTGISSPYEAPVSPDLRIQSDKLALEESLQLLSTYIVPKIRA